MQGPALHRLSLAVTAATLAIALGACRQGDEAAAPAADGSGRPDREWTDAARVEAIASALQACSYEGAPQTLEPAKLNGPAPGDCRAMVDRIMGFTGLPANFVVTAGPVSNAVAVILQDEQKMPQRVIAFNPDFIATTQRVTGGGQWGPVSIMAHEIGHHLSGHTITAGGSRPGIELEADKFSGFVLYKMGAPLAEATRAIDALGSETEQATHPAKARRIAAITQGWQEACRQGGGNCAAGTATAAPATTSGTPAPPVRVATLPAPSRDAIPFKYGRFVVDETGKLDAGKLREFDDRLQALARDKGVELAVLVVNDLRGMTPDDYAWAMMRQLRVGQLDLGNGGVIVIAPNQNTAGTAFAPGVAKKLEFFDAPKMFNTWLGDGGWQRGCGAPASPADCAGYTGYLLDVVGNQLGSLDTSWRIRFNSIEEAIAFSQARLAERRAGRKWDPKIDQASGSLIRFTGTVTDTAPKPEPLRVNDRIVRDGKWRAVLVRTDSGQETTLYLQPRTAGLMPAGELKRGQTYTFVGELNSTGQFHTDQGVKQVNPNLWLFSYEAL